MPTEAEFERTPDAIAGRSLIEERLKRLAATELQAFWEAVGRCYASAAEDEDAAEAPAN